MRIQELRRQKGELVTRMREILNGAEAANRGLNQEEQTNFDAVSNDIDKLNERIEREERTTALEAATSATPATGGEIRPAASGDDRAAVEARQMAAFRTFIAGGERSLNEAERRDLQADVDPSGGYIIPPQQFVNQLIKFIDDYVFMRRLGTTMTLTTAASLGAPSLDTDVADADWTSEIAQSTADTAMAFGRRELTPHPLSKEVKISAKLLRLAAQPVETLVRDRLGYKFGITEEKAFLSGTGVNQPLGIFTATANGISTARDVVTGSATGYTDSGMLDLFYALKPQYQARATWLFHRDSVKKVRQLKASGTGEFMWQPGLQAGVPDTLLGRPVVQSEYVPNTFTTGLYVGMVADFSQYWIVTALDMQIQRLNELYARNNQVGFIGRMEVDGMPVLEEAFVRIKTS